jgi:hypothetical protein
MEQGKSDMTKARLKEKWGKKRKRGSGRRAGSEGRKCNEKEQVKSEGWGGEGRRRELDAARGKGKWKKKGKYL